MSLKILILPGLIGLGVSITLGLHNYRFVSKSVRTEARVKSIDKASRWITPTFEYTVKNKRYEFEGSSTSHDGYKIGDKEIIYYDPSNPEDRKVGTFMALWFIPVFCGGFAIILLLVSAAIAFQNKITKNKLATN